VLSGDTRDITEDLRELHVHLHQGFLPGEDVRGAMRHELSTRAEEGAPGHKVRVGTTGRLQ
jgi:hypothetical protein